MDISAVNLSSYIFGASSQTQAAVDAQNTPGSFKRTDIGTIVQLSLYGQTQASLADLQTHAQGLNNLNRPPTFEDFQVVVQGFVQSLNSFGKSAGQLAAKQDVLNPDSRSQALNKVSNAVADPGELATLNKIGISQGAGGTFSINQKQLGKSFLNNSTDTVNTIFNFADRVTQAVDKQNSAFGLIGRRVNDFYVSLNKLGNISSTAQSYLGALKKSPQFTAAQFPTASSYTAKYAISAYSSISSL